MPEVNNSDAIRSQYLGTDKSVNIQKAVQERTQIEDQKLDGVEFRDKPKALGRDDFMKLLVKQMTSQDPTAPMQDQQFIAQMAQFSALEQMKNMADGFQSLSNRQAISLVGKFVIGKDFTSGESVTGIAHAVFFDSNGAPFLKVGGRAIAAKDVEMVGDPSAIKAEFGGTAQAQPGQPQPGQPQNVTAQQPGTPSQQGNQTQPVQSQTAAKPDRSSAATNPTAGTPTIAVPTVGTPAIDTATPGIVTNGTSTMSTAEKQRAAEQNRTQEMEHREKSGEMQRVKIPGVSPQSWLRSERRLNPELEIAV